MKEEQFTYNKQGQSVTTYAPQSRKRDLRQIVFNPEASTLNANQVTNFDLIKKKFLLGCYFLQIINSIYYLNIFII